MKLTKQEPKVQDALILILGKIRLLNAHEQKLLGMEMHQDEQNSLNSLDWGYLRQETCKTASAILFGLTLLNTLLGTDLDLVDTGGKYGIFDRNTQSSLEE